MRMTNKIMQNNSLYNINNTKELTDKLSTQMSTKKKITRPSDDPVIAIRALRLRSDVSQITQFYEKNAKDGASWLKVTGDALETTSELLKSMIGLCTQGAVKDFDSNNIAIVIAQLKELKDEFYSTGNVDYAGRYMFTGYRTDTLLRLWRICRKMKTIRLTGSIPLRNSWIFPHWIPSTIRISVH